MSGSEIIFLLVAGLVVLGPERLPGVIRRGGKMYGDLRRAASGYEKEFRQTFSEPLNELKSTADHMRPEQATYPKPNFSTPQVEPPITNSDDE